MTIFDSIAPALSGALAARGYETLTPVQTAVLAPEAGGADLLVSAQTGSGKTVAFGIAIAPTLLGGADRFDVHRRAAALVIAPTRELAMQVQRELEWLYAETGARIASCVGGMDMRTGAPRARAAARTSSSARPAACATTSRAARSTCSELRAVVLDEADEMLDLGFREDLEFILDAAPADRRTLMFSATVPQAPSPCSPSSFQHDALRITATSDQRAARDIEYQHHRRSRRASANMPSSTRCCFYDAQNTIVFCVRPARR